MCRYAVFKVPATRHVRLAGPVEGGRRAGGPESQPRGATTWARTPAATRVAPCVGKRPGDGAALRPSWRCAPSPAPTRWGRSLKAEQHADRAIFGSGSRTHERVCLLGTPRRGIGRTRSSTLI
jgi:hypothetical protein